MGNNDRLPSHFRDFVFQLNEHAVEYVIIGGYAVGSYGHIRGTNDLDIFINATEYNAQRMLEACKAYGISSDQMELEMFLVPKMIGIGAPPLRIEILKKLDAMDFEFVYQRKKVVKVDGIGLNVISLDDLILLKRAAIKGRDKARDREDLNFLEKLKRSLGFD